MNILITGGASGLGRAITSTLAEDGLNRVYFTYNSSAEAAAELETTFTNTRAIKCDFNNKNNVTSLQNKIKEIQPDVLINNAYNGELIKTYFHKIPTTDFLTDFENNIMPVIAITQAAISIFRTKKQGKIITVLTEALTNEPPIGWSAYLAGKAYLAQMARGWATENRKYNITSDTVSPSLMRTNLTSAIDDRIIEQMIANHPEKKLLTVNTVANTIKKLINSSNNTDSVNLIFEL